MIFRYKVILVLMFALIAGGLVGLEFLRGNGRGEIQHGTRTPTPSTVPANLYRGFALQLHNSADNIPYEKYINEIATTGANTLSLVVTAYQENAESNSLFIDARKTPPDERIKKLITHAHKTGLQVILVPIVLLEDARAKEWRGAIEPRNWDAWWEDYTNYITHYAKLAQSRNAEVVIVGAELLSTEHQEQRWRELIKQVRKIYNGLLCYSANWDHYRAVKWWDALDIMGMTTYYDLTGKKEPSLQRLIESWKPVKKKVLAWQAKVNRPILFTEVGWPNQVTAAKYPWDYYRSPDEPDPQLQADCFEAFFRTWYGEPAVAGMVVWEWRNHPGQQIGPEDTSYVPCGKPAIGVIRKYYLQAASRSKPADTTKKENRLRAAHP